MREVELPCYICVLDFEASCWNNKEHPRTEMEIIEFPSILYYLDKNGAKKVDEFHEYVKPTFHPKLSSFCTELTGITQDMVNKGDLFATIYERHHKWLVNNMTDSNNVYFLTCGGWDLNTQLPQELKKKRLPHYNEYKKFINIKKEFTSFTNVTNCGMMGMLHQLDLEHEGRHHSGIDDTRNIAKIFLHLVNNGYKKFHYFTV
jgi:ERI1 exoribonuclease 3